jgi:hypothetical protein
MPQGNKTMIDSQYDYEFLVYKHTIRCDLCHKPIYRQISKCDDLAKVSEDYAGLGFKAKNWKIQKEDRIGMCDFHLCNACVSTIGKETKQ